MGCVWLAGVKEHLKSAGEFFEAGVEHFESGRRSGSLMVMREGCKKVFHAYTEVVSALIQKRGFPESDSHSERRDALNKLGEKRLVKIGDDAFLYLHSYAYYGGKIFPEVDKCLKDVDEGNKIRE
ncbi:MAG: hypothetical protein AOA65_0799 [Candidatus Bathyarchaeota archaeon BA1]|nr:MAG: hypothetical protein AOA65_0799 [Candidatus Bathyarchaeota archaeon BA1]